jgi:competence protein ComEA
MPAESPDPRRADHKPWLLRRADQFAVAILCAFSLVALAIYWVAHGGLSGRLIEIDRVDPLTVQYKVDINKADWPEFVALPDIGELLAKRIIEYREQSGPFESVDQLQRVRGIGPRILERLRPFLAPVKTEVAGN